MRITVYIRMYVSSRVFVCVCVAVGGRVGNPPQWPKKCKTAIDKQKAFVHFSAIAANTKEICSFCSVVFCVLLRLPRLWLFSIHIKSFMVIIGLNTLATWEAMGRGSDERKTTTSMKEEGDDGGRGRQRKARGDGTLFLITRCLADTIISTAFKAIRKLLMY